MPSYQFNNFTGRLREAKHLQPLYPISPKPLHNSEPLNMVWDSIKTKPVSTESARAASSGAPGSGSTLPPKMLKTMAEYQKNLDTPVYLIRGTPDKILFGVNLAVMAIAAGISIDFIYRRCFKR